MFTQDNSIWEQRFTRCTALNEERLSRALKMMCPGSRLVLKLLPLLLHYNHPRIPGYRIGNIPCGIDGFVPDPEQQAWLRRQGVNTRQHSESDYSIYALYTMGSTSSIGQNAYSDLDIWVCVSSDMPQGMQSALAEKCSFISAFCGALGTEVNLYVMAENRFISNWHDTLDNENCGSAQSLFLLDEFYRSCVRLCGRRLVWHMISPEEERRDYRGAVAAFMQSSCAKKSLWFDFGSVANSSPTEYFGSGLWLLYKGLDSPFKAVLKILLMEVYSGEYPNTCMISMDLKGYTHRSCHYNLRQDSYYLLFRKVCAYLKKRHDLLRLKLVRLCFYLKISRGVRELEDGRLRKMRMRLLRHLRTFWKWPADYVDAGGDTSTWKISRFSRIEKELFYALIESYKALLSFSVRHGIEYAITSYDAEVLSRKLYAAHDLYPGKIILTVPEFCTRFEEPALTFIRISPASLCSRGWHLYAARPGTLAILGARELFHAENLTRAVAWACFNGVYTQNTAVFTAGACNEATLAKTKALFAELQRFFGRVTTRVRESELQKPREIARLLACINLEYDPTVEMRSSRSVVKNGSALSFGRHKLCLAGSISIVLLNTWGEYNILELPRGEKGVVEFLSMLLRIRNDSPELGELQNISICTFSKYHNDLIRYDLQAAARQILRLTRFKGRSYIFEVGRSTYIARNYGERGVTISKRSIFGTSSLDVSVLSPYNMRPEFALQVPPVVDKYATPGVVQYFFAPGSSGRQWIIYVVNENNEVKICSDYTGSRAELVNAINRFYTRQQDGSDVRELRFNLPQYFVLSGDLKTLHPFTIREQQ